MDPHRNLPIFQLLGDSQEFDGVAQFLCIDDITKGDLFNTFNFDFIQMDPCIEGNGRKDGNFSRCIKATDISGWIRLGITFFLCLFEHFCKIHMLFSHPGQHVVRRPIDNSHNEGNPVACQGFFQRSNNGDSPSHRCLKKKIDMVGCCQLKEFFPVNSHNILIGRNNVLTGQ